MSTIKRNKTKVPERQHMVCGYEGKWLTVVPMNISKARAGLRLSQHCKYLLHSPSLLPASWLLSSSHLTPTVNFSSHGFPSAPPASVKTCHFGNGLSCSLVPLWVDLFSLLSLFSSSLTASSHPLMAQFSLNSFKYLWLESPSFLH